jgi:hypothetical protein
MCEGAARDAAVEGFVFSVRAREDGACVVRGQSPGFEFEAMSPAFVEAQAMADRFREWVAREARRD